MRRSLGVAVTALVMAFSSVGCAAEDPAALEGDLSSSSGYPLTIENCGVNIEISSAPQRVVTIKSSSLELLLALGLKDRIVGSAYLDGDVPQSLTPGNWEPRIISDELPGREELLSLEPDFVFAGWESNLSADGVGDRETLARSSIESYISPPACEFGVASNDSVSYEDIFNFIQEVGLIFEAEDEAQSIISAQRDELAGITRPATAPQVLWYSSGSDTPFVGGGAGTPQMIMDAAGVSNLLSDEPKTWFSMPWESFVASDPEYIILVDAPWNSAEQKREQLLEHPVASEMGAVREGKFIEVPFAATEAGIRNVSASELVAAAVVEDERK